MAAQPHDQLRPRREAWDDGGGGWAARVWVQRDRRSPTESSCAANAALFSRRRGSEAAHGGACTPIASTCTAHRRGAAEPRQAGARSTQRRRNAMHNWMQAVCVLSGYEYRLIDHVDQQGNQRCHHPAPALVGICTCACIGQACNRLTTDVCGGQQPAWLCTHPAGHRPPRCLPAHSAQPSASPTGA